MALRFFGRKVLILISLIATASATPMFFGGGGTGSSISLNANWGEVDCTNGTSCSVTSPTRTIIGAGTIKMSFTNTYVVQYSQNGGAFTTFSNNATLVVANSDTCAFKILAMTPADGATITVTDNGSGGRVGDFSGFNAFGTGG